LPSGRSVLLARLTARDVSQLCEARSWFETDADAASWLIERLALDTRGRRGRIFAAALSAGDLAALIEGIKTLHRTIRGVPLFERPPEASLEPPRANARAGSLLNFVDRYIALDHAFGTASNLAALPGP